MNWLRSTLFTISFLLTTLVLALIALPLTALPQDAPMRWLFGRWCKIIVWLARYVLGAKIELRGLDNLPKDAPPPLLISKHQSELDIILMGYVFPEYGAIAMRELDKYPLLGRIISKLGYIKVDVTNRRENQLPQVLEGAARVHSEGRPILIYPEGTLMAVGSKLRYRTGVWHIYEMLNEPAYPVALSLGLAWPQRDWHKNPGASCAMEFLEPIQPGLSKQEFMALLEERIEMATNSLIREQAPPETLEGITFDYDEMIAKRAAAKASPSTSEERRERA